MMDHLSFEQLNAGVDSMLDGEGAAHLRTCMPCTHALEHLRSLTVAARALPPETDPPAELWDEIRTTIEAGTRTPLHAARPAPVARRQHAWLAAAAVILVVVTAVTTARLMRRNGATSQVAASASGQGDAVLPVSLSTVERSYRPTLEDLSAAVAANRGKLSPETVSRVDRNLKIIDDAIAEVRDALAQDPNNGALMQMLAANYRQKIELLRRVSEWVPTS